MKKIVSIVALGLTACGTQPLIPNASVELTPDVSISTHQVIGAAATGAVAGSVVPKALLTLSGISVSSSLAAIAGVVIYLVYDPLAPNWEIKEQKLSDDTYRLDMRMKRYHTGGQGEAMQVLRRRAETLQMQGGFKDFQVVEYTEGIESKTFGAHRYAEAKLRLVKG